METSAATGALLGVGIACAAGLIWYFRRRGKPEAGAAPPGPPPTP